MALWLAGAAAQARAEEFADEVAAPTAVELEELIQVARQEIDGIDARMAALAEEEESLMRQAREAQRGRFDVRQQILEEDEGIQEMVQRLEALHAEMSALQEALAQRMAQHPDYVEHHTMQTAVFERSGDIQRETMSLANDRVRAQLDLQALERMMAEMADTAEPEPQEAGTTPAAEDPDYL